MKFAVIIGLVIAAVAALLFWAQQPRMIDERTIAADSPDEMFTAMGQTYHAMRIFDSDRTFYRFVVQGRAGAVSERWEVPVPTEKLATSYVLLARDEILFGKHGEIVWSDDGKRVSFRVNGTEVSAYNTEDGGHSFQGGFLPQRVDPAMRPSHGAASLSTSARSTRSRPNSNPIRSARARRSNGTASPTSVATAWPAPGCLRSYRCGRVRMHCVPRSPWCAQPRWQGAARSDDGVPEFQVRAGPPHDVCRDRYRHR